MKLNVCHSHTGQRTAVTVLTFKYTASSHPQLRIKPLHVLLCVILKKVHFHSHSDSVHTSQLSVCLVSATKSFIAQNYVYKKYL